MPVNSLAHKWALSVDTPALKEIVASQISTSNAGILDLKTAFSHWQCFSSCFVILVRKANDTKICKVKHCGMRSFDV